MSDEPTTTNVIPFRPVQAKQNPPQPDQSSELLMNAAVFQKADGSTFLVMSGFHESLYLPNGEIDAHTVADILDWAADEASAEAHRLTNPAANDVTGKPTNDDSLIPEH